MDFRPIQFLYSILQWILDQLLSPTPPPPNAHLNRPRIAIIGAGLTGVSSASHCVGHGFDVTIFEAGDEKSLGGIWSKVNNTSGLQIHSVMYRFHPSVKWSTGYPDRQQIVSQITQLWKRYGLQERTKFNTCVTSVTQDKEGLWIVNDPSYGRFDGVMAAVGSCGDPKMPHMPGQENFKGEVYHSSRLDGKTARGKKVVIIGGGASAVEALEFVVHTGAKSTSVLARSEKWIIPRNAFVDTLLAFNIFGQETIFSWIPESLLRIFFYRDLDDLAPQSEGLFTETPMVNSDIFQQIRAGKAEWLRGDILGFTENGIRFNHRSKGVPKGGPGRESIVDGDMVIMATGFARPSLAFLPEEVFKEPYAPPNWYLQVFPPEHMSICANNCTYVNAIGTVGNISFTNPVLVPFVRPQALQKNLSHSTSLLEPQLQHCRRKTDSNDVQYHIGIYTRLLLMFLVDPFARPQERWMKRWIDMTKFVKRRAPTGALDFFTYSELIYWFVFVIVINPFRWKWAPFVLSGIGSALPLRVVRREDSIRNGLGLKRYRHE